MGIEENKNVVARYFENFSAGKIDEAFAMFAENATWWIPDKSEKFTFGGTRSKAEYLEFVKGVFAVAPEGMRITPTGFTAEGDRIAVEAESYAVVTGKVYINLYHFLFKVQDGKIQSVREYTDTLYAYETFLAR